jgi:hypothetical protein
MKKYILAILLSVSFLGFADEASVDSRLKALEETVDQIARDQANAQPPELVQRLDWGKGWGFAFNSGYSAGNNGAIGIEAWTPDIGLGLQLGIMSNIYLSGKRSSTRADTTYLAPFLEEGLKVFGTSPLFFNFSRIFYGAALKYHACPVLNLVNGAGGYEKTYQDLWADIYTGIEFFISPKSSVYLEFCPAILNIHYLISPYESGEIWDIYADNVNSYTLKFGIKLY